MKKKILSCLLITLLILLVGCGSEDKELKDDINIIRQEYLNGSRPIDYEDSASFENALNDGEKVYGKIVQFDVREYKPDSALGINCWSGEHLNFISDNEFDVNSGDIVVGYVKEEAQKKLGSWKIPYVVLDIKNPEESLENVAASMEVSATEDIVAPDGSEVTEEATNEIAEISEEPDDGTIDNSETTIAYATDRVKVRQQPNTDCEVLGMMNVGDSVTVLGTEGDWSHVSANGVDGYIKSEFLSSKELSSTANDVANVATASNEPAQTASQVEISNSPNPALVTTPQLANSVNSGNDSNFNTYDNEEQQQTAAQFVLNTSSMKVHFPKCNDVKKISPENYATSNESFSDLQAQGYTSCGHCKPH